MERGPSSSPWVAGPWEIVGLEVPALESLARELSLAKTVRNPDSEKLHTSLKKLVRHLSQRPMNYRLFRSWSWERCQFVDPAEAEDSIVRLEWWQRPQRLDRPDYFFLHGGDDAFFTYSRNWALLSAAKFSGVTPYAQESGRLCSIGFPWVFLPPGVGRFCFAGGGAAAGPLRTKDGGLRYVYPIGNGRAAVSVLEKLGFAARSNQSRDPRWLEALATARALSEPLVPLGVGRSPRRRVPVSLRPIFLAHGRVR
jgi:hypothetical protein